MKIYSNFTHCEYKCRLIFNSLDQESANFSRIRPESQHRCCPSRLCPCRTRRTVDRCDLRPQITPVYRNKPCLQKVDYNSNYFTEMKVNKKNYLENLLLIYELFLFFKSLPNTISLISNRTCTIIIKFSYL